MYECLKHSAERSFPLRLCFGIFLSVAVPEKRNNAVKQFPAGAEAFCFDVSGKLLVRSLKRSAAHLK